MKKFLLLIVLTLVSLPSFSQTATDTSLVILPEQIAREVIKELLLGDSYKKELDATNIKLDLINKKVAVKDSIILSLESKIENLLNAESNRKQQIETFDKMTNQLETDLKKEKLIKRIYQFSTTAILAGAVVLGLL